MQKMWQMVFSTLDTEYNRQSIKACLIQNIPNGLCNNLLMFRLEAASSPVVPCILISRSQDYLQAWQMHTPLVLGTFTKRRYLSPLNRGCLIRGFVGLRTLKWFVHYSKSNNQNILTWISRDVGHWEKIRKTLKKWFIGNFPKSVNPEPLAQSHMGPNKFCGLWFHVYTGATALTDKLLTDWLFTNGCKLPDPNLPFRCLDDKNMV